MQTASLNYSQNIFTKNFQGQCSVLFKCPWALHTSSQRYFKLALCLLLSSRGYYNSCKKLMKNEVFALIYLATLPPPMNKQSNNTQKINADFNLKMHDLRSMQCECTGNRSSRKLLLKESFHVAFHEKELSQSLDNLLSKNRKTKYCFFFFVLIFYFFVSFFLFFFFIYFVA